MPAEVKQNSAAPPAPAADGAPADRRALDQALNNAGIETDSATGKSVTSIYLAFVAALEARRHAIGVSQDQICELTGAAERSWAKMIHSTAPSGREATWRSLQRCVNVLFADGFSLKLTPTNTGPLTTAGTRRKIMLSSATYDRKTRQQIMAEIGRRGATAYKEKVPRWRRIAIAKAANRKRNKRLNADQRSQLARHAANARMKALSREERRELARRAARARWARTNGDGEA